MDLAQFWNNSGGYEIDQSLRFNSADSAYLNKAVGTATPTDSTKATVSLWVKRAKLGVDATLISAGSEGNSTYGALFYRSATDTFRWLQQGGAQFDCVTTSVYRDTSAWYHIVLVFDTNNATASSRNLLYINNQLVTLSAGPSGYGTNPSQTASNGVWFTCSAGTAVNNNLLIGAFASGSGAGAIAGYYHDGLIADANLIDGQALTPSSFGETDAITGAWIPKRYTGSYGIKGFYLNFSDNSGTTATTLGKDYSGNDNNFTPNNFSVTAGAGNDVLSDSPTTNWCTFNPLANAWSNSGTGSVADGNLYLSYSSGNWFGKKGTMAVSSGKWYYEWTNTSGGTSSQCGFTTIESASETGSGVYRYRSNGEKVNTSYTASYGATWSTAGDIIGIALDIDAGTIVFYKNGVSQGTAFSSIPAGTYIPECVIEGAGYTGYANFGQRAFEYTPPTGYKALNTANLPEPTIKDGSKYFDTKLYTANNQTAQTISGLGFSPDLLWFKPRSRSEHHYLYDQVRGAGNRISSSQTIAEVTGDNSLTAFTSDGFSLGTDGAGIVNYGTDSMVAWAWDAGGTGSSNNAGTITSTVSANASAGFSIVSFNSGSSGSKTVGHGLGVVPQMIITKDRDNATNWTTYHASATTATDKYLNLNGTAAVQTASGIWGATLPTSTVFGFGSGTASAPNANVIAYCFSEVAGYSKFGSYTGNGSSDGPFVFCGFRPRFLLMKRTDSTSNWMLRDTARATYNAVDTELYADLNNAESGAAGAPMDFLSNGFKLRGAGYNSNGATWIFAAFAELPFKYANAR